MSEANAPKHAPIDIGLEALPNFAVLPDAPTLFAARATRFRTLATEPPGHPLAAYLTFLADLSQIQNDIQADLPPATLPGADDMEQALDNAMPPLPTAGLALDDVARVTVDRLLERAAALPLTGATKAALDTLQTASESDRASMIADALTTKPTDEQIAQRVLVLAGLQVHFARLAAQLDAKRLKRIADGVCPACGTLPVSSSVVGWPASHNMRFCTCSLCSTMWNVVRVKCVLCSATEGISYRSIESTTSPDAPAANKPTSKLAANKQDTIKAETCDACKLYVKVLYQVKDHLIDPVADDVASLGLDMMMAEDGWQRGGSNPFLLGY